MATLTSIVDTLNQILWDYLLIVLLCGVGIYYTVRLRFIQVVRFKAGLVMLLRGATLSGERAGKEGMSSFQAVATAVAGQVGTGNLAGLATALIAGGPGAVFWMWISSFLGMATIYAEAILAQTYRATDRHGQAVGGPAYYIEQGLHQKWLAVLFAILLILALGLVGNMVQSNSITHAFALSFGANPWLVGLLVAGAAGLVVVGGLHRIAAFTEKMVPLMVLLYLCGALLVLLLNYAFILAAFKLIFIAAFNPQAALGGAIGISIQQAARFGIARGLFSNEAGMGSTPHAHAVAKVNHAEDQALIAMMGVFIDCLIITMTALVIISAGMKSLAQQGLPLAELLPLMGKNGTGIAVTQYAYQLAFGGLGGVFVSISLMFFAFSTIIGWYYYAETNVRYLFDSPLALRLFQILVIAALFAASLFQVDVVWNMADAFNGLMVIPNVIALVILAPIVIRYRQRPDTP
ncbi:alanine glycine permease [Edwardsiella hoshinae]|uniref:Alanine glycine permease n=1 Tax=Edwardsiella hoshinae TaxID=93378 RepID=A0ABN4SZ09_9GAMM|nr:sodium:alanine symporter family protein [Edwardsiella hoshinae]AOV97037.1 alanine glycine permease [Edwardsiella hoshinae]